MHIVKYEQKVKTKFPAQKTPIYPKGGGGKLIIFCWPLSFFGTTYPYQHLYQIWEFCQPCNDFDPKAPYYFK